MNGAKGTIKMAPRNTTVYKIGRINKIARMIPKTIRNMVGLFGETSTTFDAL
jgi:hypothetical protein